MNTIIFPHMYGYTKDMSYQNRHYNNENKSYKKIAVDGTATVTSAFCYYPLRTFGARWMKGLKTPFSIRVWYSGFPYGCLGAHQIFVMAYFNQWFKERKGHSEQSLPFQIGFGAVAGAMSATTATPFEAKQLWLQRQESIPGSVNGSQRIPLSWYYRGFIPMCLRQGALSLGMFVFPDMIRKKIKHKVEYYFPGGENQNPKWMQMISSILGGSSAAVISHVPELARMRAQSLEAPPLSTKAALVAGWEDAFTSRGRNYLLVRLGVVTVATIVMDLSRKIYMQTI